jgi:signal peptidase I
VLVPVATAAGVWLLLVGDGIACARSPADTRRPHALSVALAFVVAVIADEALAATIRGSFAQAFTIASRSMEPGMALGDRVLVDMRATATAAPSRGDHVVFRYPKEPEKSWVKRIGGLPGETVEVRDKRLLVDGEERTELPAVYVAGDAALPHSPRDQLAPTTIPVDEYFVVGDNRDRSYDSRFWGTVPRRYLLGKARLVYFSWDAEAHAIRWSRIGTTLD